MTLSTAIFISGRGSNLKVLLENQQNFSVRAVLSNKPEAAGLQIAQQQGISTFTTTRKNFPSLREQKEALYQHAVAIDADLVLLAGYMQLINPSFIELFRNRILNIHPSLLPDFPGLDPHQQALETGAKKHGCTVHLVNEEVDAGEMIAQAVCDVLPGDTPEILAERVLSYEHQLYSWVVNQIGAGDIVLPKKVEERSIFSEQVRAEAKQKGILLGSECGRHSISSPRAI